MKNVIGLDIGGTKINGIVWDGKKVVDELTVVTPNNLYNFEKSILKLVDFLSANRKIAGVGVGMAGSVDNNLGIVRTSPNIKFVNNLNLVKFFKLNRINNALVDNDANCFTRAQLMAGGGKRFKNFLCLTLGTGVGGGIVINGKIYRGQKNAGAELGHIILNNNFLEKSFQIARDKRDNRALAEILGSGLVSFVNIFSPEAVILGGGVATDKTRNFIKPAQEKMRQFVFGPKKDVKIIVSKLKNAGAIGAALLV